MPHENQILIGCLNGYPEYKMLFGLKAERNIKAEEDKGKEKVESSEVTHSTESSPLRIKKSFYCFSKILWETARIQRKIEADSKGKEKEGTPHQFNKLEVVNEGAAVSDGVQPSEVERELSSFSKQSAHENRRKFILSLMQNAISCLNDSISARVPDLNSFSPSFCEELLKAGDLYGADQAFRSWLPFKEKYSFFASYKEKDLIYMIIQEYINFEELDKAENFIQFLKSSKSLLSDNINTFVSIAQFKISILGKDSVISKCDDLFKEGRNILDLCVNFKNLNLILPFISQDFFSTKEKAKLYLYSLIKLNNLDKAISFINSSPFSKEDKIELFFYLFEDLDIKVEGRVKREEIIHLINEMNYIIPKSFIFNSFSPYINRIGKIIEKHWSKKEALRFLDNVEKSRFFFGINKIIEKNLVKVKALRFLDNIEKHKLFFGINKKENKRFELLKEYEFLWSSEFIKRSNFKNMDEPHLLFNYKRIYIGVLLKQKNFRQAYDKIPAIPSLIDRKDSLIELFKSMTNAGLFPEARKWIKGYKFLDAVIQDVYRHGDYDSLSDAIELDRTFKKEVFESLFPLFQKSLIEYTLGTLKAPSELPKNWDMPELPDSESVASYTERG